MTSLALTRRRVNSRGTGKAPPCRTDKKLAARLSFGTSGPPRTRLSKKDRCRLAQQDLLRHLDQVLDTCQALLAVSPPDCPFCRDAQALVPILMTYRYILDSQAD